MAFIDGTVVTVALPVIQSAFWATMSEVQWVIESYVLFPRILASAWGSSGDRFGRLPVYVIGVAIVTLASAWCGLSTDVHELIIARAGVVRTCLKTVAM